MGCGGGGQMFNVVDVESRTPGKVLTRRIELRSVGDSDEFGAIQSIARLTMVRGKADHTPTVF